jgi:hypothetical protein
MKQGDYEKKLMEDEFSTPDNSTLYRMLGIAGLLILIVGAIIFRTLWIRSH